MDDLSVVDLLSEGSVSLLARWTKKSVPEVAEWIQEKFAAELEVLDEEGCARCDAYLKYLDSSSDESSEEEEESVEAEEESVEEQEESVDEDDSESGESSSEESTSEEASSEQSVPAKRKAGVRLSFLHLNEKYFLRMCHGRRRRRRVKRQTWTESHLYNVSCCGQCIN